MTITAADFADILEDHADRLCLSMEGVAIQANLDLKYVEQMASGKSGRPGFMGLQHLAKLFGTQFLADVFEIEDQPTFSYTVPINPNIDTLNEVNERMGTDYKTTDWHMTEMIDQFDEKISEVISEGGAYIGDCVEVKVYASYMPENK